MPDTYCDFVTGTGTCNNLHGDPSGLCSTHRNMPGETLRQLRAELVTTKARLNGTTAAVPTLVAHERARIVAWLRGWEDGPGFGYPDGSCDVLKIVADAIEKGEHLSGTTTRSGAK